MERFVPHYTCKKIKQTGITCMNVLMDYFKSIRIHEKRIRDLSQLSDDVNKKLLRSGIFNFPSFEQLNKIFIHNKFRITLFREEKDDNSDLKQEIHEPIEDELFYELEIQPVMLLMNLNALFGQKNTSIGYVIVLEYNPRKSEFIIYDPLYYTRVSRTKHFERLDNTPKRRYISVKREHFLNSWHSIEDLNVFLDKKKVVKPFRKEFITITSSNT